GGVLDGDRGGVGHVRTLPARQRRHVWQWSPPVVAARAMPGLRAKNPAGLSMKPTYSHGMTGQSSGRTKWVVPSVSQATMSSSTSGRSAAVQRGSPSPPGCWLGKSPAARRSSAAKGVIHRCLVAKVARAVMAAVGSASRAALTDKGTSLYATGSPTALVEPRLTIFQ